MFKEKKGSGSAIMFFAFIFIMLMMASSVFLAVGAFYGRGVDYRQVEAEVVLEQVRNCFEKNQNEFFGENFDFFTKCNFNKNVFEQGKHLVFVKDVSTEKEVIFGVRDFLNLCEFVGSKTNKDFPKCVRGEFVFENSRIEILVGSAQNSRRVAL